MLNIVIQNTGEGTNENASYRYHVYVNDKEIECNFFSGHNREDGWAALVKAIAERHLTQRALDLPSAPAGCKCFVSIESYNNCPVHGTANQ